jgi:hypothetical protein
MSRIKAIFLILVVISLSGCEPGQEARQYLPTVMNSGVFTNGGWIVAELTGNTSVFTDKVSGELIAIQDHQLFILTPQKLYVIPDADVFRATLYMYKKQPWIFAALTFIGILPNLVAAILVPEYAGQLLAIGIVQLVIGSVFTVTEAATRQNQLIFPMKNSLNDFVKFSRFPQGIPPGLDLNQLKLPESKKNNRKS